MQRAVVVSNSWSARSRPETTATVVAALRRAGWSVDSAAPPDANALAAVGAEAVRTRLDLVVAVGGDGTVARLAGELAGTAVALGIVPAGTGNLLAHNLGIPPSPVAAARIILAGATRRIDLGRVTSSSGPGRTFAIACGVGFDAVIMRRTPPILKRRWGQAAYFATAMALSGQIRNVPTAITIDGFTREVQAAEVFVANFGHMTRGIHPRRPIVPDDGQLDVIVIQAAGRLRGLLAAWEAVADAGPGNRPGGQVWRIRATEVRLEALDAMPVEIDGDPFGRTPVTVSVLPAALSVRVPLGDG